MQRLLQRLNHLRTKLSESLLHNLGDVSDTQQKTPPVIVVVVVVIANARSWLVFARHPCSFSRVRASCFRFDSGLLDDLHLFSVCFLLRYAKGCVHACECDVCSYHHVVVQTSAALV